jgi:hypothetical protein
VKHVNYLHLIHYFFNYFCVPCRSPGGGFLISLQSLVFSPSTVHTGFYVGRMLLMQISSESPTDRHVTHLLFFRHVIGLPSLHVIIVLVLRRDFTVDPALGSHQE